MEDWQEAAPDPSTPLSLKIGAISAVVSLIVSAVLAIAVLRGVENELRSDTKQQFLESCRQGNAGRALSNRREDEQNEKIADAAIAAGAPAAARDEVVKKLKEIEQLPQRDCEAEYQKIEDK